MLTQAEFDKWFADFQQRYPAVKEYLQRQDLPSVLADTWYQAMAAFDLETLQQVTALMVRGDLPEIPNTELGHFGSEIRARARQVNDIRRAGQLQEWQQAMAPENERRYYCALCLDTGYLSVVGPKALKQAWNYDAARDEPKFVLQPTAIACMCPEGDAMADGWKKKGPGIGQWYPGCDDKHALLRIDGPNGIVHQATLALERGEFTDVYQAQRTITQRQLKAFDARKKAQPLGDYGGTILP